jgi:signal transduction histidine kinase
MSLMKFYSVFTDFQSWMNRSIQRKLIVWSIGFWIISVTVLSLVVLWTGRTEITRETNRRNIQLASTIARDVNAQISNIFSDVRMFSRYLEAADADLESQAEAILALRLASSHRYCGVYYFDSRGALQLHVADPIDRLLESLAPSDIVNRPPIPLESEILNTFNHTNGTNIVVSEISFTRLENMPVVYLGIPVSFPNETRVAVFEIDLRDIWQRIDLGTLGKSGFTYAVSRNGLIIAHPEKSSIGRIMPAEIEPLLRGYEGFTEYNEPSNNRNVIAAYSPVGGPTGWGIVVVQDKSEAFAPVIRSGILLISIWLSLALLGTIGIFLMIRSFTKPIVQLTRTTQSIAQAGDLTKLSVIQRHDELGQMSRAFDQMVERLKKSEIKLAHAAAEERNRLARDLHDAVSQTLFSATLIADVLPRLWDRNEAEARKRLEELRQLTRGALAEMRTLLLELRPTALIEAEIGYLLHQLGESITGRLRIPVTVTIDGQCTVSDEVKVAFYRIAQESLNNVAKHAGAKHAWVNLICEPQRIILKVKDDGQGFDINNSSTKSLGLGIIRERAREIDATLTMHSQIGVGTEITVEWKYPPA